MDTLLDLDGEVLVVDPEGGHWVRFVVTRIPVSLEKPHGLDYSLTLHGPDGERLVGFDNANRVAKQEFGDPQDHRHRLRTITTYEYRDAASLLADFWNTVDSVLRDEESSRDNAKSWNFHLCRNEGAHPRGGTRGVSGGR